MATITGDLAWTDGGDTFEVTGGFSDITGTLAWTDSADTFEFTGANKGGGQVSGGGDRSDASRAKDHWKKLRDDDFCILMVIEKWLKSR